MAETLSKASAVVLRIGTDAHLYDDPEDVNVAPILDSKFESEKCETLKRLLALIPQGFDVSIFFPQMVKNVAAQSSEVKKLVYLYLLRYAEKDEKPNWRPNEALLSINYFQKDLGNPNPLVRALALRTMAWIRLHVIAPLALAAVGKCARILLQCTSPLLWSNNSAVVLAAAGVQWIMAPLEDVIKIVKPLLFLLRSSSASNYVVLCHILVFAKVVPSLFAPHFENFFICSSDAYQVKAHKLEILSIIAATSSISSILRVFEVILNN